MTARYEIRLDDVTIARFDMREKFEAYMFFARVCADGVVMVDMLTNVHICKKDGLAVRLTAA